MNSAPAYIAGTPDWIGVRTLDDIEFLVKESEVLTGQPGRRFVVASADHLDYQIHWHPLGMTVERLDGASQVLNTCHLLPWEFVHHSLAEALAHGQLFTAKVPSVLRGGH
jgi:hypothetical protein